MTPNVQNQNGLKLISLVFALFLGEKLVLVVEVDQT